MENVRGQNLFLNLICRWFEKGRMQFSTRKAELGKNNQTD